jgi:hypothetical protein
VSVAKPKSRPKPAAYIKPPSLPGAAKQLARVRRFCLALPGTTERPSHGAATFFVKQKVFVYFVDNHHGDGRLALWCAAPAGAQAMLVDSNPAHYFVPPYVGHRGWVGVRLDLDAAWREITSVIESAYDEVVARRA